MNLFLIVVDYSGCSSFAESKCSFKDDIIIETVDEVTSIDMCQFYCSIIYSEACEYFVFDRKLQTCDVMKTSEMETCVKNSGGNKPNATSCGRVFIDGIYEHECLVRTNNYIFVKTENDSLDHKN